MDLMEAFENGRHVKRWLLNRSTVRHESWGVLSGRIQLLAIRVHLLAETNLPPLDTVVHRGELQNLY